MDSNVNIDEQVGIQQIQPQPLATGKTANHSWRAGRGWPGATWTACLPRAAGAAAAQTAVCTCCWVVLGNFRN